MKAPSRRMSGVLAAGAVALAVVSGTASTTLALPTPAFAATASASELVVDDNYPALYGWINNKLNDATSIKISTSSCGVSDNGNGMTVIPAQVKSMTGWQQYFWESEGKAYDRQLGYASNYETLTFASSSTTTLDHLTLKLLDDHLVIPAGANITFKNCTFTGRVKIETGGKATFENCTFKTATILNNGQASYTGTTKEPTNKGTAQSSFEDLGIVASKTTLNDAVHGHAFQDKVKLTLSGTNAKKATISASIDQADSGLTASVDGGAVTISGTPAAFGTYTATITAVAPDESGNGTQSKSVAVNITVHQDYTFTVEGSLDAVRTGQGDYQDSSNHELTVYVTDEAGNKQSYFDFSSTAEGKAYSLKPQISPEGAGLSVTLFNAGGKATITLSGTAGTAGTYQVGAAATLGDYTFGTNTVELRIYSGNETLASQIAALSGNPDSWDMEPYEIDRSDNATIPSWLHHIYGSHTSGLYGQIGNATDAAASDTLTIPAGADVTLENIKINSSVKIVVEKGGKLTLTDSCAFGPIEVNGGTLTLNRSSSVTNTITLNNGSTLKDSEVVSHAQFLTDGRKPTPTAPAQVVTVNGSVAFEGANTIKADQSQIGLKVTGTAQVPAGSNLTVTGGNGGTAPGNAASAIELDHGTITGAGALTATGGSYEVGGNGFPATAVTGTGTLSTGSLTLTGGDADTIYNSAIDGADAGVKTITVTTKAGNRQIAGGKGVNGGADGKGEESLTIDDSDHSSNSTPTDGKADSGKTNASDNTGGNAAAASAKKRPKTKSALPTTGDYTVLAVTGACIAGVSAIGAGTTLTRKRNG